jgi:DNA/RNA-binding domain of Phe-tRNA-synthetase-like protein
VTIRPRARGAPAAAVQDTTGSVLVVAEAMHDAAASDLPELIAVIADELNIVWSTTPLTAMLSQSAPGFAFAG